MKWDILFKNGTIYTMNDNNPKASWVGIQAGKIIAAGLEEPNETNAEQVIDLKGQIMFPGFIDSHLHGTATGEYLQEFNLKDAKNINEILEIVKNHCQVDGDGWIKGSGLDIRNLEDKRPPSRFELDKVSKNHPVYIKNRTMHGCLLNSKAMDLLQIPEDLQGIVINEEGEKTGELSSDDSTLYAAGKINKLTSDEEIKKYIHATAKYCVSQGCTTICCLDGNMFDKSDRDFYMWMYMAEQLPLHITHFYQTEDVHKVKALGLKQIGGCLCLDGATFEGTMAAREPYNEKLYTKGILYWSDERLYRFLKRANEEGLQTAMHAIGDAAIDQYLRVYEKVYNELGLEGNPNRNRIEHFSLVWPDQIKKAISMGLILSMQPIFTYTWDKKKDNVYEALMDKKRADRMEPFAEIVINGGIIAGGSDSPVTAPSPLKGIHAAVNLEKEWKRLSVHEAIRLFTVNGAIANRQEDKKGTIEAGKLADFVVLDADPYENADRIQNLKVMMTVVEGKVVFEHKYD